MDTYYWCNRCGNLSPLKECPFCSNNTILGKLRNEHIFSILKLENGNYKLLEECDQYFSYELTKEEFRQLITELQEMINGLR